MDEERYTTLILILKSRSSLVISNRTDFKTKIIISVEKEHNMMKASNLQEDVITLHTYASDNRGSKCMRQKVIELQGETDESTIIAGDSYTPRSEMDRSSR